MQLLVSWFRKNATDYPRSLNTYILLTWHFPESLQGLTSTLCKACHTKACYLYATSCLSNLISAVPSTERPIQCSTKWPGQISSNYIMSESRSINPVLGYINVYTKLLRVNSNNFLSFQQGWKNMFVRSVMVHQAPEAMIIRSGREATSGQRLHLGLLFNSGNSPGYVCFL